jgi:hypothetical protein
LALLLRLQYKFSQCGINKGNIFFFCFLFLYLARHPGCQLMSYKKITMNTSLLSYNRESHSHSTYLLFQFCDWCEDRTSIFWAVDHRYIVSAGSESVNRRFSSVQSTTQFRPLAPYTYACRYHNPFVKYQDNNLGINKETTDRFLPNVTFLISTPFALANRACIDGLSLTKWDDFSANVITVAMEKIGQVKFTHNHTHFS